MIVIDSGREACAKDKQKDIIILTLPGKPEYVSVARLTVSGIASRMGFDVEAIEDIKLAVSEACTNAIKHGCKEAVEHYEINISTDENCLSISISDKGCGFEMGKVDCPDTQNPREGGMGLFIIKTLMDEVNVSSLPDSGCTINMKKYLEV